MGDAHVQREGASFRLLKLPPEVRNNIYHYLLTENRSLAISRNETTHGLCANPPRELVRLIQTGKSMHQEVAPILYGLHTVVILSTKDFREWIISIGSMRRLVRKIEIRAQWSKQYMRGALRLLKRSPLESIDLTPVVLCKNVQRMALAFKPFIKAMLKAREGQEDRDQIFHKFRVIFPLGTSPQERARAQQWEIAFQAELRKLVEE